MTASPEMTNTHSIRPRSSSTYSHRSVVRQAVLYSGLLAASTVATIALMLNMAP